MADESFLKMLFENYGLNSNVKESEGAEVSQDTAMSADVNTDISSVVSNHEMVQEDLGASGGPVDLDCLWNY